MARQLHLNLNLLPPGSHPHAWRSPKGNPHAALDIGYIQSIARIAERGCFDAIFLADALALSADPTAALVWSLDPIAVLTAIALATTHIGIVGTSSTTFSHPYNLARAYASLDLLSGGRAGWNAVTTYDERVARNFGMTALPAKDTRYAIADDFVELVVALWDSWQDGALLADPATGRYIEPVDAPQQVVGRNMIIEPEIVEQLRRLDLHPHHSPVLLHPQQNGITTKATDQQPTNQRNPPQAVIY